MVEDNFFYGVKLSQYQYRMPFVLLYLTLNSYVTKQL